MSKKRNKKNKRKSQKSKANSKRSRQKKKENVSSLKKSRAKKVIAFGLSFVCLFGTILGIWVVISPRMFVQPGAAFDPNNPAFTEFIVHNQGNLSVYDIKISNSVGYLNLPGNIHVIGLGDYTNRFSDPKHVASKLLPNEQYSVQLALSGLKINNFQNADLAIVVIFKWLWNHEKKFRFVVKQGKDGQWHWLPRPIEK